MDKDNKNESSSRSLETTPIDLYKHVYKDLPQFVLELFKRPGFEGLFLTKNPRYLTLGYIDYLPDFGTRNEKKSAEDDYWHGKMMWRFVGWNIGKKYTGEQLREIRKEKGVGSSKMRKNYAKKEKETRPLSG